MFCIYCGSDNPEGAIFCRHCGKRQTSIASQAESSSGMLSSPSPSSGQISNRPTVIDAGSVAQGSITAIPPGSSSQSREQPVLSSSQSTAFTTPATSASAFASRRTIGFIIAGVGGVVALLAFFFMPYISYSYFSFTGQQLASFGNQAASGTGQISNQLSQLQLLWLEPVIAGIVVIIAGYQLYNSMANAIGPSSGRGGAISLIVLGGLTLVILLIVLGVESRPSQSTYGYSTPAIASFLSSGFWMYLVAMVAVVVGGGIAVAQAKSSV